MATFDLEAFVVNPTREVLNVCRKCDLLEIARHFNFPVSATLRVGELREAVLAALVSKEVLALLEPDSFGGVKASSVPVTALEEATVKSTTVSKTETVVTKTEEKKEAAEVQEGRMEEPAVEEKKEQEQVDAELVAAE